MLIKNIYECDEFVAGDDSHLREVLHPKNDKLKLRYSIAHVVVSPEDRTFLHRLKTSSEVYYILQGRGMIFVGEEVKKVKTGDVIYIPPGFKQKIHNIGKDDLAFLCIVSPPWSKKDEEIIEEE